MDAVAGPVALLGVDGDPHGALQRRSAAETFTTCLPTRRCAESVPGETESAGTRGGGRVRVEPDDTRTGMVWHRSLPSWGPEPNHAGRVPRVVPERVGKGWATES
ncbi:hypothetical protein GCM10010220_03980 [Streptomyces parvulus]|nr:hypothetical protein GCM10010220_03980 [Streptomyces parvulus]